MADKITYILGAGASIGAFPLVKGTEEWNNNGLAQWLCITGYDLRNSAPHYKELQETASEISQALIATGLKADEFGNVDTYAKYLYHTGQKDKLKALKIALTFYFVQRQLCYADKIKEKRYLNFVTSIITERNQFPNHVKILNWNYDFLMEQAGALYRKEEFHVGEGATMHSPAFVQYFPHCGYQFNLTHPDFVTDEFSLVHLNGIAGFYLEGHSNITGIFQSIFNDLGKVGDDKISTPELLKVFQAKYMKNSHLITFAWEKRSESKASLINNNKIAQQIIKGTTILVVIGYSFPFYNREVDNMIFETLIPTLKKIYFQDPYNDGEFLRKRYDLGYPLEQEQYQEVQIGSHVDIEHINETDQFYIPVEV